jgi:hypothetical protein
MDNLDINKEITNYLIHQLPNLDKPELQNTNDADYADFRGFFWFLSALINVISVIRSINV